MKSLKMMNAKPLSPLGVVNAIRSSDYVAFNTNHQYFRLKIPTIGIAEL
jgi:hypothetical protein